MTSPHDPYQRGHGPHDDDPRRTNVYGGQPGQPTGNVYGTPTSGPPQQPQYGAGQPQQNWGAQQPGQPYGQPQQPYGPTVGYPQPPAYGPPPKKKSGGKIALVVIGAIVGLCLVGGLISVVAGHGNSGSADPSVAATQQAADPKTGHTVTFEVAAKTGKLTLVNWSILEDSAILNNPPSPWKKSVTLETATGLAGVNVSGTGTVTCRLLVDGKVIDEGESDAVVNCSDTIGF